MANARKTKKALSGFHEPVREWFTSSFESPTRAQELGWPSIQSGGHTLLLAPTGSGKTLAAFLDAIDRLMFEPIPPKNERCRILYVSPLKALAVDVEKNLRRPLSGISRIAEHSGITINELTVAIRTGDTPGKERAAFSRKPADILITTPESLYLLLTSNARETLRSIQCVIIDEIHAMVATKRGAHLALSLERLEELAPEFQRIGLSATQRPLDEVARFLGGYLHSDEVSTGLSPRPVQIVDAGSSKVLDLHVEIPLEDMAKHGESSAPSLNVNGSQGGEPSIWASIHPLILDLIRSHQSTLIFVNSRRLAERMAASLNELAGEEIVHAHHGSIAREQRLLIENELKSGRLPAMVATSSLELGIDMGAIDLVIQVEAPPSVASGMQRIGRAGHQVGVPSKGIILPKYRGDLLACAALTERMLAGAVEEMRYLRNPLDILAQQIVAMVSMDDWSLSDLSGLIHRSAPFTDLPDSMLIGVLDMLSGKYPSDEFAELRPRITWDRINNVLHAREGGRRVAVTNAGSIPDRGLYGVFLLGSERGKGRVGELDEEMVFESKVGDTFVLGASTWRVEEITHDRVIVSPAPGLAGRTPFWHGENAGRPLEFGKAIGALTRKLRELTMDEAITLLQTEHCMRREAARSLISYLSDQASITGAVPDDRTIVIESSKDEMGEWRVCILTPFGSRVHAPWAMAIAAMVWERRQIEPDVMWTDNGIIVRFPDTDEPPAIIDLLPVPDEVEDLVVRQLSAGGGGARSLHHGAPVNTLFASRFREAAARALLIPRKHPGKRAPLWLQRKRAVDLLNATGKYGSFPIILETFRECLKDVFEMPALVEILSDIRSNNIQVVPVVTHVPSPFASALLFFYVANFMYEGDAPIAERRAQALLVDPTQLRQLLGEIELRELIDSNSLGDLDLYLQHLTPDRAAHSADSLHDLFIRLGDLSEAEVMSRVSDQTAARGWIEQLIREGRLISVSIATAVRMIATEDAGRYRDALGTSLPGNIPDAFLEEVSEPLGDLVARYARTHGPFNDSDIASRYGTGIGPVRTVLTHLELSGRVVEGEFRPGGKGKEWCDAGVLRALRQKSLAKLRHDVEPVDQQALGRFYLYWQGVKAVGYRDSTVDSPQIKSVILNTLIRIIGQIQGFSLPASALESEIIPARFPGYEPRLLDELMASGMVLWVGDGTLGNRDGRIRLFLAQDSSALLPQREHEKTANVDVMGIVSQNPHSKLIEHLASRGASFFSQIQRACGGFHSELLDALWDLVWEGQVTNDTLQPLRALMHPSRGQQSHSASRPLVRRHSYYAPRRSSLDSDGLSPKPEAAGRWSLVSDLIGCMPSTTERLSAQADQLLERYGILTREAVQAEGVDGGFSTYYGILKAMEDAAKVRRGYFVSGLGATQFALPGAVDGLRGVREPLEQMTSHILSATDPANPYGAALPWPERLEGRRPVRSAGASVILVDGALVAWLSKDEHHVLTFLDSIGDRNREDVSREVARVLASRPSPGKRRAVLIETVDGVPTAQSRLSRALTEAEFVSTSQGLLKRA